MGRPMIKTYLSCFLLGLLFWSSHAFAFPGMIRHGYVNCTSCHVSPSGGGVLTPYGRELSGEVLSTWAKEGEGKFLYGAFADSLPENLMLGGDTRIIQTYQDNPIFTEKRFYLMQSDVEGAYRFGKFTLDLEVGYLDTNDIASLRQYIMYQFNDENTLRLGKFRNNYGINTDEHQLTIKSGLGWDVETETYNLEFSRLTGNYSFFATAIFGAPESVSQRRGLTIGRTGVVDHGASVRASAYIADKYEIGANYFYGKKSGADWRSVTGPFVILGFTPHFFYLGELDFQDQGQWGVFDYQRLTYEPVQGVQLFITQELARPQFSNMIMRIARYGLGLQYFPRPHYELDLRWNWEQDPYDETRYNPLAWIMLHLYL